LVGGAESGLVGGFTKRTRRASVVLGELKFSSGSGGWRVRTNEANLPGNYCRGMLCASFGGGECRFVGGFTKRTRRASAVLGGTLVKNTRTGELKDLLGNEFSSGSGGWRVRTNKANLPGNYCRRMICASFGGWECRFVGQFT
jgi:hypothetical protein